MGIVDRDWFREDHKKREQDYGGDFSLHSKKKQTIDSLNSNQLSSGSDAGKNALLDTLTIAIGAILYLILKNGKKIPGFWDRIGMFSSLPMTIGISAGCMFLGIILFAQASKRRDGSDKGLLNVLALIVSMLIFAFMAVVLFISVYTGYFAE